MKTKNEKPILFSTIMVQSILAGNKTQTRRIIKPQPKNHDHLDYVGAEWKNELPDYINSESTTNEYYCRLCGDGVTMSGHSIYKSKYQVGDILWVKEMYYAYGMWLKNGHTKSGKQKWRFFDTTLTGFEYHYFDNPPDTILPNTKREIYGWFKRSSLFMPYKAARIFLKVTNIKVERLQDISNEDAIAEGVGSGFQMNAGWPDYEHIENGICTLTQDTAEMSYASLWESINGKGSWDLNFWVWVIEFEKTEL